MKKFVTLVFSAILLFSLAACGSSDKPELEEDHSLYLITDQGTINDKSFNQGSYEGMEQYAHEVGITPNYLRPTGESTVEYIDSIEKAIAAGAKVIVTPGFLFEEAVFISQDAHPDVKFILVDGVPNNAKFDATHEEKVGDNTVSILYREEQSGFLAGYAAVKSGFTELGFMGGIAVPPVINFGYGYLAGANLAAEEEGVKVNVKYTYLGKFNPSPEFQNQAVSWFNDGVEVIFASAGGAGNSVMAAAEEVDGKVIGVDVDQSAESDTVITSATKNLKGSVYEVVKSAMTEGFKGGEILTFGVGEDGVTLPDNFDGLEGFGQAEYDALYARLKADEDGIQSNIPVLSTHGDKVSALSFDNVTIESIE